MTDHPVLQRPLVLLWIFAFLALLIQAGSGTESRIALLFVFITAVVWATLFTLPTLLFIWLALKLGIHARTAKTLSWVVTGCSYLVIVFLIANIKLYSLYGFYTNYFVVNLVTTTGGVDAMGISDSTWLSAAVFVMGGAIVFVAINKWLPVERIWPKWLNTKMAATGLLACFATESAIYVYADYVNHVPVLNSADRIIWYVPITADSLLADLGVARTQRLEDAFSYATSSGNLDYFDAELLSTSATWENYNIVWLVAESWRADTVTAEVMPHTFAFANQEQWFRNHYSGGNGTRMGMFTQFYGLYGHYWFDVLRNRRPPLLMEKLRDAGYQFGAFTSSAFTYPEFDKTVFSGISPDHLQEFNTGHGWERDQKNTTDLIDFITTAEDPFFAFMFFESAHANYYFPDEDIIEQDYLKDFNYLTVDIEANMPGIKARYVNATHHLDRQLARVYEALEAKGLMDNTIVVVTGDHGEEFMENGRWGHNSTFSQQQIRVPLILHLPAKAPAQTLAMTSHLDIPATLLNALGDHTDSAKHSFGADLFDVGYKRDFLVVSDWHGNTLVTPELKIIFSLKGAAYDAKTTDLADNPIDLNSGRYSYQAQVATYLNAQNRFFH